MTAPTNSRRGCTRNVEGYPISAMALGTFLVKANQSLIFNSAYAPGEILGMSFSQLDGTLASYTYLHIKLEVDNLIIFDDYFYFFLMAYHGYTFNGLFATNNIQSGSDSRTSFAVRIPYETMYRITLYTSDATGNTIYCILHLRYGA